MMRLVLPLLACLVAAAPAVAQQRLSFDQAVQKIEATVEPAEARPGQTVTFRLSVRLNPDWYTYPTAQLDKGFPLSRNDIQLPTAGELIFVEPVRDPADAHTKTSGSDAYLYYPGGATWEFRAVVPPAAAPGEKKVRLKTFKIIVCYEKTGNCLNPKVVPVEATFRVAGEPIPVEAKYAEVVRAATAAEPPPPKKDVPPPEVKLVPQPTAEPKPVTRRLSSDRDHAADTRAVADQLPPPGGDDSGFWVFVGTAALWGFITLLTPCVFPMIPITVSIFVKQGEKTGASPLRHALVYATTIVVLLTVAALTLLTLFRELAVHPVTNVLLGALFVALALSLFGLFELTLPSSLADLTGNKAGRGGYVGTAFMAASFTVISFTCVAPFLGTFSGVAASGRGGFGQLAAGALAFALAFASPFFLLALFPSLIKKVPKSGDWMNMIKVTMGFLELAAALKFFRTAELRWLTPPAYFTYDMVLSLWVAILIGMALYLFGLFRTRHDHEAHDHVGPVRILFGLGALGLAVHLTPALFSAGGHDRNRPAGAVYAWVDSFLLPEPSAAEVVGGDLAWSGDLRRALDDARSRGGLVFVDFTGVTCTNCKLNERDVFIKPEVKDLFKQYSLVQVYTDTVPEFLYDRDPGLDRRDADARANARFQLAAFGTEQLPLYVILKPEPSGMTSVVGVYKEGKINNEAAFVQFLRDGLK